MTNLNGDGAASNGATTPMNVMESKFDANSVAGFWMSSSARLMRSSEILWRGMMDVARLEAELGQQYLQRGLGSFQMPTAGMKPDELARTQADQTMQGADSLFTAMRKIGDRMQQTITESTQALFDVATPTPAQSLAASIHIDDPAIRRRVAPAIYSQSVPGQGATG